MNKKMLIAGSLFGLVAVVIGAFGAHGLKKAIDVEALATFETGVKYQMYHALLLLLVANFALSENTKKVVLTLIVIGIICFSGSIYGLATNALTSFDFAKIAMITPIGGSLLIAAWAILLVQFLKRGR